MKIVLINTLYDPYVLGGAGRSVQFLAEALAAHGEEPVVVSLNPGAGDRTDRQNGVRLYYAALRNFYGPLSQKKGFIKLMMPFWHGLDTYNPWMAAKVTAILNREQPDLVHTNNLSGFSVAAWVAAKRLQLPIVHTLRDHYLLCPRSTMFHRNRNCVKQCWYCRLYASPRKHLSGLVNAVVGNSRFILLRHLRLGYFPRARTRNIVYSAYPSTKRIPEFSIARGESPLNLGFLGRLKPNKGIEYLLRMMKDLSPEEVQLWVGGEDELSIMPRFSMPHVHHLGFVDPDELFRRIDVLVVPSLWQDPLPRTVFEAYAHGIPVLASNRGGIPEIVEEGVTGFTFDPDRPHTFLNLIQRLKQGPALRSQMRRKALEKSSAFLPERSVPQYLAVYRAAIYARGGDVQGGPDPL